MSKRCQPDFVNGCNQHSGSDSNRFFYIIVGLFFTRLTNSIALRKYGDKIGGFFQKWLFCISTKRCQCFQPLISSSAFIKLLFLFFSCFADFLFYLGITHHRKMPRLLIGSIGSSSRSPNTIFDYLYRYFPT